MQHATARRVADLDIPRNARADDPTLQKAVNAYRQARTLDDQLKRSERAVERQTAQLRKELKQTKVEAAEANTKAFRQEVRMDEDLLNEAESETRRDKRLVRQAETEMRGDKAFLEDAYRTHKGWDRSRAHGAPGDRLNGRDRAALADIDCPAMKCHEASAGGFLPTVCSSSDDCPRIQCWDYQESGACRQGRICSKPSRQTSGCTPDTNEGSWRNAKCPGMHCMHAKRWGYAPAFCTLAEDDDSAAGNCPQLDCFNYVDQGGCDGNSRQDFARGRICKKPQDADEFCRSSQPTRRAGGSSSQLTASGNLAGISPLHNSHSSKSVWYTHRP
jgi:hypothetical protein